MTIFSPTLRKPILIYGTHLHPVCIKTSRIKTISNKGEYRFPMLLGTYLANSCLNPTVLWQPNLIDLIRKVRVNPAGFSSLRKECSNGYFRLWSSRDCHLPVRGDVLGNSKNTSKESGPRRTQAKVGTGSVIHTLKTCWIHLSIGRAK